MKYKRLCKHLNDYGTFIPAADSPLDHIKDVDQDWYLSVYEYTEEQKNEAEKIIERTNEKTGEIYNAPRGVAGMRDVVTDTLVFDFDIPKNTDMTLEDVKADTLEVINRLKTNGFDESDLQLTFSGSKGFGVAVKLDEYLSPDEHKRIAKKLAEGLKSWDSKVYNSNRILRVPLTRHQKSGLYKMPLDSAELQESIESIQELSKDQLDPEMIDQWYKATVDLPPIVKQMGEKPIEKVQVPLTMTLDIDFKKKPRWISNWKFALMNGYFPPGTRNTALMILAATFKGQNFPKEVAGRMLKGAAELQARRFNTDKFENDVIWGNHIKQVYDELWDGGTWAEDNFPDELKDYLSSLGIKNEKAQDESAIESVDDVFSVFENFAENIDQNTIPTGIRELDNTVRLTTSMLVGLLGAPGAGKTSAILKILNEQSNNGEAGIFFSLDMGRPLVYAKMAQKHTGKDFDQVLEVFKERDEEEKQRIKGLISKNYENVQLCFKTGATVSDMRRYIEDYQDRTGKKVKMIAVDYLEKVVGPFSDATANSASVAKELQTLANDLDMCVIVLLQPQKMAGTPADPLLSYRNVKGASVIEQDCRVIISVFREGYHAETYENDKYITFAVLKNTMGTLGKVDCAWDGVTGGIYELDEIEKDDLEDFRKAKAQLKLVEDII